MMKILFLMVFLQASAAETWLTVTRTGHDSQGASTFDRFEITPDGLARWETSAFGVSGSLGCQNEGGSFEGRVSERQVRVIAKAAREAMGSQKSAGGTRRSRHRASILSIMLDVDKKVKTVEVSRATAAVSALLDHIDELETELRPKALVVMQAVRSGAEVHVSFDLAGSKPVTMLLPANAGEAFNVDNATLGYAKAAPSEVMLTPASPHAQVVLTIEGGAGAGQLRYSNATGLHHASGDALEGDRVAPELALCAGLTGK